MTARLRFLAAMAWLLPASAAHAAPVCTLLSTPEMNFGFYSALGGTRDAESTMLMSCTPDLLVGPTVSYTISMSPGTGNPAGYLPRRLVAGAFALEYNLYTDLVRTTVWGDGSPGTAVVGGAGAGACSIPVYGRIPAGQAVPAAQYRDDVVVTVDF